MIDYSKFVENSRKWLSNYIKENHLQSLVIGVSGGIDSTVSCAIAYPVCKGLNIPLMGRSLPTSTNKTVECKVADLVGRAFCKDYRIISLDKTYFSIEKKFQEFESPMNNIQKGNIKARLRMMYLRNIASIHRGVVLDNDNFTEWNLGFWTVGGDSPMDINLGLHYLWKTEVYELAKYFLLCYDDGVDEEKFQAIRASMHLVPTDGNGVSSSDCEQFRLDNYSQVDDVLRTMYYNPNHAWDTPEEKGDSEYIRLIDSYSEQGVDKVMMLHQDTEYKRQPAPIMPTKGELGL